MECTLEELYKGATKEVHVVVMQKNQYGLLIPLTKSFNIDIKAGFHAGTKYTFTGHGDLVHENQYKDIVFVLKEKQHPVFQRSKHDLILTLPVSLKCSSMFFNVKLLDGSNKDFFWQKELALNELRCTR